MIGYIQTHFRHDVGKIQNRGSSRPMHSRATRSLGLHRHTPIAGHQPQCLSPTDNSLWRRIVRKELCSRNYFCVSFPVKSNLCTIFPTELVLRKNSQVGVRICIVPHQNRSEAEQHSLGSFCEQLDGFNGLADLIDNSKAAMGISIYEENSQIISWGLKSRARIGHISRLPIFRASFTLKHANSRQQMFSWFRT